MGGSGTKTAKLPPRVELVLQVLVQILRQHARSLQAPAEEKRHQAEART